MRTHQQMAAFPIDCCRYLGSGWRQRAFALTDVQDSALATHGIRDLDLAVGPPDPPRVTRLTPTARVEHGPVENDAIVLRAFDDRGYRAGIGVPGGYFFCQLRTRH